MGKPQYKQKFRQEWLKEKIFCDWLQVVEGDPEKAYCKICCSEIRARKADLLNHSNTAKHLTSIKAVRIHPQGGIKFKPVNLKSQHAQAAMALFVSTHSAILAIDHLGELCNHHFPENYFKLHRTKCSAIITNVLAPFFIKELKNDIGFSKYSLLIDESTDISVLKYLGIGINYFSKLLNKIVTTFLSLEELTECTAIAIVDAVKNSLKKFDLKLNNLIGIGSDNASVMVGVNTGVHAILKKDNPHLILIRCVCHSLQLATSHACSETIPRHLDYLISETYNWFSKSTLRQQAYKDIYKCLNENHDPLKIVQACNTRWLSIESAVVRIVDQWYELKVHFQVSRTKDKCYSAEMLYSLYNDEHNLAYLLFLRPLLGEIQRVNKLFESEYADSTKLGKELLSLTTLLGKIIVLPSFNFKETLRDFTSYLIPKPYLGFGFENKVEKLKKSNKISVDQENILRQRCKNFLIVIVKQLLQRLPDNIQILEEIEVFSPQNALSQVKDNIISICKHFGIETPIIEKIDLQWRKINLVIWKNKKDAVQFWAEVNAFTDAAGVNPFKELSDLALSILSLPWSNAACERIFSQMNLVKNKTRNRMNSPMLTSILYISLKRQNKCCNDFKFPDSLVREIGTLDIYKNNIESSDDDNQQLFNDI